MRKRLVLVLTGLVAAALVAIASFVVVCVVEQRLRPPVHGPYQFDRPSLGSDILAEAEALEIAERALKKAGFNVTQWAPLEDSRARPDQFLLRNVLDITSSKMCYVEKHTSRIIVVRFRIDGDIVFCEIVIPR